MDCWISGFETLKAVTCAVSWCLCFK